MRGGVSEGDDLVDEGDEAEADDGVFAELRNLGLDGRDDEFGNQTVEDRVFLESL